MLIVYPRSVDPRYDRSSSLVSTRTARHAPIRDCDSSVRMRRIACGPSASENEACSW